MHLQGVLWSPKKGKKTYDKMRVLHFSLIIDNCDFFSQGKTMTKTCARGQGMKLF
jgi:hypothetical protein